MKLDFRQLVYWVGQEKALTPVEKLTLMVICAEIERPVPKGVHRHAHNLSKLARLTCQTDSNIHRVLKSLHAKHYIMRFTIEEGIKGITYGGILMEWYEAQKLQAEIEQTPEW